MFSPPNLHQIFDVTEILGTTKYQSSPKHENATSARFVNAKTDMIVPDFRDTTWQVVERICLELIDVDKGVISR